MKTKFPRWRWNRDRFCWGVDLTSWVFGFAFVMGSAGVTIGPLWFEYDFGKRSYKF